MPKGRIVIFSDGNRRNFDIDNLRLVSRAELCLFNKRGYSTAPAEVRPTLLLVTQLDRAVIQEEKN